MPKVKRYKSPPRRTISGRILKRYDKDWTITLHTRVPDKWILVDLEFLDFWVSEISNFKFRRANEVEMKELRMLVEKYTHA